MTHRFIEIQSLDTPGVEVYCRLTESQLRSRLDPGRATIIVESPKVITTALDAGFEPLSLLAERRHLEGDAAPILSRLGPDIPVYTGSRETLAGLTGYTLTRGVLCAMRRPEAPTVGQVIDGARRVVVIDGVTDTTNIGAIFRSAAALEVDAVLLTPTACDPLNRRSIRVSMGSVFLVPWTWLDEPPASLSKHGFTTISMALTDRSVSIDDPSIPLGRPLAIVVGTEGDGLAREVIDSTDIVARIPMHHQVDSLNVAAAAAVAFWQLRPRQTDGMK